MKIKKLPEEARSKLQSGLVITDAVQCVLELVHNSLDAEATGVAVRIDLKAYQIRVIDNGKGIGREDLELVGEKYMTSKYDSFLNMDSTFPTYGFKGQALSSLLDVCKSLTIKTRSEVDGPTFVKVFENSKDPTITDASNERNNIGTTVIVEDFMCTMPVRRKRISEIFDLEEIKSQLQYLAIIHCNVCFTLRNENKGLILLQTPQASSTLEAVSNVFGKTVAKSLKPLQYKEKKFEVTGFIGLKPQLQSNVQLLFVNKRIIAKGVTHKFLNNVMKEYVGKYNLNEDPLAAPVVKGPRTHCHNIFILEIRCPHSEYELFTNMRKTTVEFKNWKNALRCLHRAVKNTFKEVLNVESSTNSERNTESCKNNLTKHKRIFGTSVLINAVKGVSVKRGVNEKNERKKKKKLSEIQEMSKKHPCKDVIPVRQFLSDSVPKEISYDSLESPIPKKHFKCSKLNSEIKNPSEFNQSFFEFYEWVKEKMETDQNAFNLYNDFMQFKQKGNQHLVKSAEVAEFKSPVVGGKPKRKKLECCKKFKEKLEGKQIINNCESVLDEEMAIMSRHQLKIFPSSCLRMKKTVQFTAEMQKGFPGTLNFDSAGINDTLMNGQPFNFSNFNVFSRQVELNHSFPSVPSSELQLTNIIQFRNWSEDFLQVPSELNKDGARENSGQLALDTWESHYQDLLSKTVQRQRQNPNATIVRIREKNAMQSKENMEDYSFLRFQGKGLEGCTNTKNPNTFHDVEIQVNISKISSGKVNAEAQTSLTDSLIPESPYFKTNKLIKKKLSKAKTQDVEIEHIEQSESTNLSQEVPNPDFWNMPSCKDVEQCSLHELINKSSNSAVMNEKNSNSIDLICGQKSNSDKQPQNDGILSKETETIAAIWADSLTEIINKQTDSYLNSESTLPKTIPVEEIEFNLMQPVESEFYLTERHDVVPKGLSPVFFHTETNKIFTLSPGEKTRLKLTVETAQSDLLAVVKWQDESTGDYVKPTIPDGILDEMRQNAGKNAMNFENPVLSASLSYCAVKVHNLLHSFAFTKELLSNIEILGQLDKKFLVMKMKITTPKKMELISLFDQHAVDERIKLEEIINSYSSSDGKFIASRLNPPVECTLNESDVRVLLNFSEKLLNVGLQVQAIKENTISVNEIPTFLLDKHEKDLKNKRNVSLSEVLRTLIMNIVDEMKETRGALSKIPKVIHNALCLEACHKAVKFNRALSPENIAEMINKLKDCKLPFQCAHGRPSVIPIIDLEDFNSVMNEKESIDFEKFKKFRCSTESGFATENSVVL